MDDRVYIVFGFSPKYGKEVLAIFYAMADAQEDKRLREEAGDEGVPSDFDSYEIGIWQVHSH